MVQIFTNMELKYFLSLEFTYAFVVINVLLIAMANSFSLNTVYSQPYRKYLFPDSGIYQVIYNTGSKNNFSSLGSFKILVPLQAASSISNPFGLSPNIIITIIIAAVAAEAYFIIIKRREKIKYNL